MNGHDNVKQIGDAKKAKASGEVDHAALLRENSKKMAVHREQLLEAHKAVSENTELLLNRIADYVQAQLANAEEDMKSGDPNRMIHAEETFARFDKALPQQWCDIGNMNLRQGFMCLRRALEQPTTF